MLAKSLISVVLSLTLPLLAVCAPPYSNCVNESFNQCLSMYSDLPDPTGRFQLMDRCIRTFVQPGTRCFALP
ncbi:hypothetical protein EDC94DRAFT_615524 [Helicostylum pulchrum]|nr:hypothetical protein EDC94DRAFT_615524 [Helicostylum pulchrum]